MTEEENQKDGYSQQEAKEHRERRQDEKKLLTQELYLPSRGEEFRKFLHHILLNIMRIPEEKVNLLLQDHFALFVQAFTHRSVDPSQNYEILELLGDAVLTFCILDYLVKRFPQLEDPSGKHVSTLSRLKINFVSKKIYGECARNLNFLPFIASDQLTRKEDDVSLLEDVFEAFARAVYKGLSQIEQIRTDMMISAGPILRMLTYIFDQKQISLEYEDLYDARSRLKELSEKLSQQLAPIDTTRKYDRNGRIVFTSVIKETTGTIWGTGQGLTKNQSVQEACENAIANLIKTNTGKESYDQLRKRQNS